MKHATRLLLTLALIAGPLGLAPAQDPSRLFQPPETDDFAPPAGVTWERDVVYGVAGDRPLHLDVLRPTRRPRTLMPAVIYVHGGAWRFGSKESGLTRNAALALRGYYTVTIEYRLSDEASWPAQINDCKAAVRWLRAHAGELGVDPQRIGAWGHSAGGHLSALLGLTGDRDDLEGEGGNCGVSSRVRCVVDMAGPSDLTTVKRAIPTAWVSDLLGVPLRENQSLAWQASPVAHASPDDAAFLLLYGTADLLVPVENGEALHAVVREAGVESWLVRVIGGTHTFPGSPLYRPQLEATVLAFFERHLGGD
jgi:acetyl esterase/lipase